MQSRGQNYFFLWIWLEISLNKELQDFSIQKPLFLDELQYIYLLPPLQWSFLDTGELLLLTQVLTESAYAYKNDICNFFLFLLEILELLLVFQG